MYDVCEHGPTATTHATTSVCVSVSASVCVQEYLASHPFVISMDFWLSHRAYEAANTYAINTDDVISDASTIHTLWWF